jgi:hypothetical protein
MLGLSGLFVAPTYRNSSDRRGIAFVRLSVKLAGLAVAAVAVTTVAAGPADAAVRPEITGVPCNSGPPAPIDFENWQYPGPSDTCFGGYVGHLSTNFGTDWIHAGGYYGKYTIENSNGDFVVLFRPGDSHTADGSILGVDITPPF